MTTFMCRLKELEPVTQTGASLPALKRAMARLALTMLSVFRLTVRHYFKRILRQHSIIWCAVGWNLNIDPTFRLYSTQQCNCEISKIDGSNCQDCKSEDLHDISSKSRHRAGPGGKTWTRVTTTTTEGTTITTWSSKNASCALWFLVDFVTWAR